MRPAFYLNRAASYAAHPGAAIAGLTILTILVRAPFSLNTGADEAFYLIVGRQWLNGVPPYAGSFDVKPPLLFLLMAGSEAIFGPTLIAAKVLATAAAAITGCGLYLFGLRYLGGLAGAAAAILYTFSALTLGSTFSTAEVVMAPFTAFGMLTGFAALLERRRLHVPALLASGLLFGAAACVKQPALFTAAPLALGLLFCRRSSRLGAAVLFAAGFCAVPVAFALYFVAIGHFGDLISDTAISAIHRAGTGYQPWGYAFGLQMAGILTVLPAFIMAGVFWVERRPMRGHRVYPSILFLGAWAGGASLGIFSAKDMLIIYALPLLQPVCLAAGGFVQHVLGRVESPRYRWLWRAGTLALAVLYSCYILTPLYRAGGGEVNAAEAAAALMLREGKRPEERIFVVDRDLLVYLSSSSEPPLPIFHPLQLLCPFPASGAQSALAGSMDSKPAFAVLADRPVALPCEVPGRRDAVEARLARDYCVLGRFESTVTAWPGTFSVFELKERAGVQGQCGKRSSPNEAYLAR